MNQTAVEPVPVWDGSAAGGGFKLLCHSAGALPILPLPLLIKDLFYLFKRQSDKEGDTQKCSICWCTFQQLQKQGLGQAETRDLELYPGLV